MKLIIDDTPQKFTRSKCECKFCKDTHDIVDNKWCNYIPKNNLQRRMLKIIKKIEKKF